MILVIEIGFLINSGVIKIDERLTFYFKKNRTLWFFCQIGIMKNPFEKKYL